MKSTILLATALFLISAPAPDSSDIAEMTANFIVPETVPGSISADELATDGGKDAIMQIEPLSTEAGATPDRRPHQPGRA